MQYTENISFSTSDSKKEYTNLPKFEIGRHIKPPYFYGVFENTHDIPQLNYQNGFSSNEWITTALIHLYNINQHKILESHLHHFLLILNDRLKHGEHISILDFGGGIGDNYVQCRNYIQDIYFKNIEYTIIDNEKNIEIGKLLHNNVEFFPTINDAINKNKTYDIALFSGVLMYIENSPILIKYIKDSFGCDIFITRTLFSKLSNPFTTIQYISPGDGPYVGKFIGIEKSTIWNLECWKRDAGISKEQIMIEDGYQSYRQSLQNLPAAYQEVSYYTLYITDNYSSKYNNDWYIRQGIERAHRGPFFCGKLLKKAQKILWKWRNMAR